MRAQHVRESFQQVHSMSGTFKLPWCPWKRNVSRWKAERRLKRTIEWLPNSFAMLSWRSILLTAVEDQEETQDPKRRGTVLGHTSTMAARSEQVP
jgi:hypothetical protein